MTRFLTAAALALLMATPAFAQSTESTPPYGSAGSSQGQPGQGASNAPLNCTPNDTRPECQTAQLPGTQQQQQQQPGSSSGGMNTEQTPSQSQGMGGGAAGGNGATGGGGQ